MARNKPLPRKHRSDTSRGNLNRARQYKRDTDNVQDVSVSLMDLDSAIMYYFTEVVKPTVVDNGETVKVPIMYSSPERWYAIQNTGFMRDKKRQVILPVIAFRRTGMSKDETIAVDKIDPEEPKLHWQFERKYTNANRYDAFSVQQGMIPQREYYNVAVPDYMVITYDFIIWTHYIEQMNKLVERINWSEGAYWGEPGKMKFRTNIDSFTDSTEVTDKERIVKTEFSVTLKGYLIPEAYNELSGPHTMQKFITPKTLVIKDEVDTPIAPLMEQLQGAEAFPDAQSVSQNETQPVTLTHPFTLTAGTGVSITNDGESFTGTTAVSHTISLPQAVGTDANVTFGQVTASLAKIGTTSPILFDGSGIVSDLAITGSVSTTGNVNVQGNLSIDGNLRVENLHTQIISESIIQSTGSNFFGDALADTHHFTGSIMTSGSLSLNGYEVDEISNDTSLAGSSATSLVTEHAVKSYISGLSSADEQTYLRKQFVKISNTLINASTASFTAVTASAPDGMTSTTEHDFIFFINGQYMEHDAISIQQVGASLYLGVDTGSIGYALESDDEILAWGKFNS
jgi:hypothetical protein|tara:strand:+ start:4115 stop:5821 length:1707 start_codon:yes stop_codon:yes gene_type:complete